MRVGLSIDPPLATIPALLSEEGVDVYQTVLRDPGRFGNYGVPEPADRTALMEGLRGRRVWGVAHGSLLINLASPEGRIRNSSVSSLLADLKVAAEVGLDAVCFHMGYTKGHPSAGTVAVPLVQGTAAFVAGDHAGALAHFEPVESEMHREKFIHNDLDCGTVNCRSVHCYMFPKQTRCCRRFCLFQSFQKCVFGRAPNVRLLEQA